jgi:bacterioferritin
MEKIMLVISSVVKAEAAIDRALQLAKENDNQLYVAMFLDKEIPNTLSSIMRDSGYLGEKVQAEVKDTIKGQYVTRVKSLRYKIQERANDEEIDFNFEIIRKNSLTKCHDLIEDYAIDDLVINYADDQYIAQVVSSNFQKDFLEDVTIPYELYLDGDKKQSSL